MFPEFTFLREAALAVTALVEPLPSVYHLVAPQRVLTAVLLVAVLADGPLAGVYL